MFLNIKIQPRGIMKPKIGFLILALAIAAVIFTSGCVQQRGEQTGQTSTMKETPSTTSEIKLPAAEPSRIIDVNLTVTVPYWTEGGVYLGVGDNPKYLKLEKINEVTYKGKATLEKGTTYFYSLGTEETGSIDVFTLKNNLQLDGVVDWKNSNKKIVKKDFQRGVTFGGMLWRPEDFSKAEYNLKKKLNDFGIEWVLIIPDWFVDDQKSNTIHPFFADQGMFPNPTNWITPTLTDDQIRFLIKESKKFGYKVVLKPHVDPLDFGVTPGASRGSLRPLSWDEWFKSYEEFITHYAKIAEEEQVDLFVVGTELDTSSMSSLSDCCGAPRDAEKRWRATIKKVRQIYSGPITYSVSCSIDDYAADWKTQCHGPRDIAFWDALDYIGFEPYFGLTNKKDPSIDELKNAFTERLTQWAKPLSEKYNKKILFTEVGFGSYDGVNIKSLSGPPTHNIDH
jgi:hypothetical protein